MDTNSSLFNESASTTDDSNETEIPLYLTYLHLFMLLIGSPSVIIPAVMVIAIIVKNVALRTVDNILLVNILIADVCFVLYSFSQRSILMIIYLLGFIINVNCNIVNIPTFTLILATKLMFLPLSIDRFIHVAFPFSYKSIMTTKVIVTTISCLWLLALSVSVTVTVNSPTILYQAFGICKPESINPLLHLVAVGIMVVSSVLITITCIYLRYRIIKSNRFFHSVKRNAIEERKSNKAGRLVEILQEQLKPTLSVFIAGGIDGLLNMLFVIAIGISSSFSSGIKLLYVIQFILVPIQLCQSVSHALTYGIYNNEIRKRLFSCNYCNTTKSKVVVLNRQSNNK